MATFEKMLPFKVGDYPEVTLLYNLIDVATEPLKVELTISYSANIKGPIRWQIDYEARTITMDVTALAGATCLVVCLGGSIGATLADCLAKAKKRSDVVQCLKDHAPGALVSSVSCVAQCLFM